MTRVLLDRRRFVASAAAGALGLIGTPAFADDGPPETTTIRLAYYSNICLAPTLIAGELLRAEGFNEIQYVRAPASFTFPASWSTLPSVFSLLSPVSAPAASLTRPFALSVVPLAI